MNELRVEAAQYSMAGAKADNEDACAIRLPGPVIAKSKGIVAAVADGVSRSGAGRQAAEACIQGFAVDYFSTPESWSVKTSAHKIFNALNRWLYAQSGDDGLQQWLTTLTVVVFKASTAHIFHIGDSCVFRLRQGEIELLTREHRRWLSKERSVLTRVMGGDLFADIDYRAETLQTGDRFLLMTDGVHEWVNSAQIKELSDNTDDMEQLVRALVNTAFTAGSQDNLTCQALRIDGLPSPTADEFYRELTALPFPPPLEAGMRMDGYKILRELHASSRTQVYLAQPPDEPRKGGYKQVVLKTPSINYEDDAVFIDQFLHEQWAAKRVDHPHLLKVLEPAGPPQYLYTITEYLKGRSLRQWMDDHPKPDLSQARRIVAQIGNGLQAMHRKEMIHRDLKPANVYVTDDDVIKIIDFGSVYIAGIEESTRPVNAEQSIIGTLHYTAPECLQNAKPGPASDVYSLGVLFYELMTGELPYGERPHLPALLKSSYRSMLRFNESIPPWVDAAVEKAVKFNRAFRYQEVSEFVYDLNHPNPSFRERDKMPWIERSPVLFWKRFSLVLFVINCILFSLLILK